MIDDDIARELARINLPLSTYTEWYWQMDLKICSIFNFAWIIMRNGRSKNMVALWLKLFAQYAHLPMIHLSVIWSTERASPTMNYRPFEKCLMETNPLEGRRLAEFEQKLHPSD